LTACSRPATGATAASILFQGKIQIPNAEYKDDLSPLDEGCECPVCKAHTKSYVRHLFATKEILGPILASMHNMYFLTHLVSQIRESILNGNFHEFRDTFLNSYGKVQNQISA